VIADQPSKSVYIIQIIRRPESQLESIIGQVTGQVEKLLAVNKGKLLEFLQQSQLWDREVWGLQVTKAGEHVLELRALMSGADAPTTFDLR